MVTRVPGSVRSKSTASASARMILVPSPAPGFGSSRPCPLIPDREDQGRVTHPALNLKVVAP
jgi:hypothetical protein